MKFFGITILIIVVLLVVYSQGMKRTYKRAVLESLSRTASIQKELLTEDDIRHLPVVVQKYMRYVGVMGKEKVINFRAEFTGGIRSKPTDEYMQLTSVQYNFTDTPTRLFYITAKKKGIPAIGLHLYRNESALFKIKILGLFTVVDAKGKEMDQGETVTVFNDMCVMAPATLIDKNISWETVDSLTVKAKYTNGHITIGAMLHFNELGQLINFVSDDRFETDGKTYNNYPWLTPINEYININGYNLPASAKLIYKYPDMDFCYGEFVLSNIEYNCDEFK
jgi:hypothetical protein